MQEDRKVNENETEKSVRGKDAAWHRRRIKRMKMAIIVVVILLLILPTICCIYLGFRVSLLQKQVEGLVKIHLEETALTSEDRETDGSYAYAAERKPTEELQAEQSEEGSGLQLNNGIEEQDNLMGPDPGEEAVQGTEVMEQTATGSALQTGIPEDDSVVPMNPTEKESVSSQMTSGTYPTDATQDTGEVFADPSGDTTDQIDSEKTVDIKETTDKEAENLPEEDGIKINSTGIYAEKKVYLTFDDGPSIYTDEILDILDDYGVKATFFVIGKTDKESKRLYRKIIENGHTLGMHSYSHVYKQIYNSAEDFDKDFTKLWKLLYDTTGYMPTIYRFPGGSGNMVNQHGMEEFIRYLKDKSIVYYDWNVDNGDATGTEFTKEQLSENILKGVAVKNRSIVLLHDTQGKRATVDSLPAVLEALLSGGAEVLPLTEEVAPIQQIRAENVK